VPLPEVLQEYCEHLLTLRQGLQQARITVVEDQPAEGSVILVDRYSDAVDDVLGCLEEALANAQDAKRAALAADSPDRIRQALSASHCTWLRLSRHYAQELIDYERLTELTRFTRKNGREWASWLEAVRSAVEQHTEIMSSIDRVLLRSWEEMTEHAGRSSISVRTTSIGQQIRAVCHDVPPSRAAG